MSGRYNQCDFRSISYLQEGSERQRHCFEVLSATGIMALLDTYHPVLVGTVPIGIDIGDSDLDIVCQASDMDVFCDFAESCFGRYGNFNIRRKSDSCTIVCFSTLGEKFEIYCTTGNPSLSNGYRHMIVEYRILNLADERFRHEVLRLKRSGIKTEPAFARLLNLSGDPYEAVLGLEKLSDTAIAELLLAHGYGTADTSILSAAEK